MSVALHPEAPAFAPPARILALADLTPGAKNAVWRAGLIAREHGALLRVLHVVPDARHAALAQAELQQLCDPLRERLGVEPEIAVVCGDLQREATRAARDADLLVLASRRGDTLRERISGTRPERLIRACRTPTLVVQRPAAPPRDATRGDAALRGRYGRVLVSVDLADEAVDVITAACCFSTDPAMEVFHAVNGRRDPPALSAQPARGTAVERARDSLQALIAASGAQHNGATASVGFGGTAPSMLLRQRALGAELLVMGRRRRGLLADCFRGGVMPAVLAGSGSDVLVVPTRAPGDVQRIPAAQAATGDGASPAGGATA